MRRTVLLLASLLLLAACRVHGEGSGGHDVPGNSEDRHPFAGIAPGEVLHLTGTEPFWGAVLAGDTLTWTSPAIPQGVAVAVSRFAGRGGIGLSGTLEGKTLDVTITPGTCSDVMSERHYPFTATVLLGGETREGCAWGDAHPFTGPKAP